jgi:hypothetical protein
VTPWVCLICQHCREQAIVFLLYDGVTLAGAAFELPSIEHGNMTPLVIDQPRPMQAALVEKMRKSEVVG